MHSGRSAVTSDHSSSRNVVAPIRDPSRRVSKTKRFSSPVTKQMNSQPPRTSISFDDEQTRKWVSEEDDFVLKQAKKKADIRVREGRAKPIDWLAVILRATDPDRDLLDDDEEETQHEGMDPESVFEGLDDSNLAELSQDIVSYLALEKNKTNQEYWKTMQTICEDKRQKLNPLSQEGRAVGSVASDVDKLLSPKSYEELETLEKQIRLKLQSDEPLDFDYWDHLLRSLLLWKARAKLKKFYQSVLDNRLETLRKKHQEDAARARVKMLQLLSPNKSSHNQSLEQDTINSSLVTQQPVFPYSHLDDPEPFLKLDPKEKIGVIDESIFLKMIFAERKRILKSGYAPIRNLAGEKNKNLNSKVLPTNNGLFTSQKPTLVYNDDISQTTKALYDREAARGIDEDEEIFNGEEAVTTIDKPQWAEKYRPRKPRYFNRVQMGYEWNKYNQTHYDHDNPPPKVVQGYKFNIFYPDLIDKTKTPTFKIIRENGRKRGMSFAPAGEEDTCLIRFIAGPPYEDIAFRIVDKEWDYSAKRDRGFRSSFDKVYNFTIDR